MGFDSNNKNNPDFRKSKQLYDKSNRIEEKRKNHKQTLSPVFFWIGSVVLLAMGLGIQLYGNNSTMASKCFILAVLWAGLAALLQFKRKD